MKKTEYKQASLTGVNALATGPAKVVRTYTPGGCQAQQELDAQAAKQGDALVWRNSLLAELRELAEVCPSVTSTDCYRNAMDLLGVPVDTRWPQRSGYSSKEFVGCFFEGTATTKCGHCYDCREHYR